MPIGHGAGSQYRLELQEDAYLNQTPPVQNTWYTVLDTVKDISLLWITTRQVNDEAAAKVLEVRLTIDGITLNGSLNHASGAYNFYLKDLTSSILSVQGTPFTTSTFTQLKGQSVKVESRITSAIGTNQILQCRVVYEQYNEI